MSRNGFPECEREYNRREEKIEMAKYQRSEAEIADLRDDVKRHIEIASFNAEDSLKWRTMFQNERDHMQAATEEIERLRGRSGRGNDTRTGG